MCSQVKGCGLCSLLINLFKKALDLLKSTSRVNILFQTHQYFIVANSPIYYCWFRQPKILSCHFKKRRGEKKVYKYMISSAYINLKIWLELKYIFPLFLSQLSTYQRGYFTANFVLHIFIQKEVTLCSIELTMQPQFLKCKAIWLSFSISIELPTFHPSHVQPFVFTYFES